MLGNDSNIILVNNSFITPGNDLACFVTLVSGLACFIILGSGLACFIALISGIDCFIMPVIQNYCDHNAK